MFPSISLVTSYLVPALATSTSTVEQTASNEYHILTNRSCAFHGLTELSTAGGSDGNAQCPDTPTYYECDLARQQLHPTAAMELWCSSGNPACWYSEGENKFVYCAGTNDFCSPSRPCVCKKGQLRNWLIAGPIEPAVGTGAWPDIWALGKCPVSIGRNGYSASNCAHKTLDKCKRECAKAPGCAGLEFNEKYSVCHVYYTDANWDELSRDMCWRKGPSFLWHNCSRCATTESILNISFEQSVVEATVVAGAIRRVHEHFGALIAEFNGQMIKFKLSDTNEDGQRVYACPPDCGRQSLGEVMIELLLQGDFRSEVLGGNLNEALTEAYVDALLALNYSWASSRSRRLGSEAERFLDASDSGFAVAVVPGASLILEGVHKDNVFSVVARPEKRAVRTKAAPSPTLELLPVPLSEPTFEPTPVPLPEPTPKPTPEPLLPKSVLPSIIQPTTSMLSSSTSAAQSQGGIAGTAMHDVANTSVPSPTTSTNHVRDGSASAAMKDVPACWLLGIVLVAILKEALRFPCLSSL